MKDVVVVNKLSLERTVLNSENIDLNVSSIVHLKITKDEVLEFIQQGNTLILKLKNGELLVIKDFFVKDKNDVSSDLVFEDDDCAFLWFNFDNGVASFKSISGLESLLPVVSSSFFSGTTGWLLGGAALVGGIAAGAGGGGSSDKAVYVAPSIKINNVATDNRINANESKMSSVNTDNAKGQTGTSSSTSPNTTTLTGTWGGSDGHKTIMINVNGTEYTVKDGLVILDDGTWTLDVPTSIFVEGDANKITAKITDSLYIGAIATQTVTLDTLAPSVTVLIQDKFDKNNSKILDRVNVTFNFDENIDGSTFSADDIQVDGGVLIADSLKQLNGKEWIAEIISVPNKTLTVSVLDQSYTDLAGNEGTAGDDVYEAIQITSVTPSIGDLKKVTITGNTLPKSDVEITLPNGDVVHTKSFGNGDWSIEVDGPFDDGKYLTATLVSHPDVQHKVSLPYVAINPIASDDFINLQEKCQYLSSETIEITGTISDPTAALKVTIGSETFVQKENSENYDLSVDENGNWKLILNSSPLIKTLLLNEVINITAQATSGVVTSNLAQRTPIIDVEPPIVKVEIFDKNSEVADVRFTFDEPINGSTFSAEDIQVEGGTLVLGSLKQLNNKEWTAEVEFEPNKSLTVSVANKSYEDIAGNKGLSGNGSYVYESIEITSVVPNKDDPNKVKISGNTLPKSEVEVTLPNGKVIETGSDEKGNWSVNVNEPLDASGDITATLVSYDIKDTVKPLFVTIDVIAEDDVINLKEKENYLSEALLEIKGTISNFEADLVVRIGEKYYHLGDNEDGSQLQVNGDGAWVLSLKNPQVYLDGNLKVVAEARTKNGVVTSHAVERTPNMDTQAPTVKVEIIDTDNDIAEVRFTFDEDINKATFSPEDIKIEGGVFVSGSLKQINSKEWVAEVSYKPNASLKVTVVDESYEDLAGNKGSAKGDVFETIRITSVKPNTAQSDKTTISGVTVPYSDVKIILPNGSVLETKSQNGGSWFVDADNDAMKGNGEIVASLLTKIDKGSKDQVETIISGTTHPNLDLNVTLKNGETFKVKSDQNGYWEKEVSSLTKEEDVIVTSEILNVNANPKDDNSSITTISGSTYPHSKVIITFPDDNSSKQVWSDENGQWHTDVETSLVNGNKLTVQLIPDINEAKDTVTLPLVTIDAISNDDFINLEEKIAYINNKSFVIKGTISNPEADLKVSVGSRTYIKGKNTDGSELIVSNDGTWELQLNNQQSLEAFLKGSDVSVTAQATSGVVISKIAERTAIIDESAPTVEVFLQDDNTVEFKFSEKVEKFTKDSVQLSQGELVNLKQDLKDPTLWTAEIINRNSNLELEVTVLDKSYTDLAGNKGAKGTDVSNPTDLVQDDNGLILTVKTGLKSEYWGYREGLKLDGPNLTSLKQVQEFMSTHEPTVTFETKAFDFELPNYGLGGKGEYGEVNHLVKFLGNNAKHIEYNDFINTSDAMIKFTGYMNLDEGSYIFKVTGDDGYQIKVNGKPIVIKDGIQNAQTDYFLVTVNKEDAGWQPVEIYYWDQAERATLKIELAQVKSDVNLLNLNESLVNKTQNQSSEILKNVLTDKNYEILGSNPNQFVQQNPLNMKAGQNLKITFDDLLSNDPVYSNTGFKLLGVEASDSGNKVVIDHEAQIVTFKSNAEYFGSDTFTYTVSDGKGGRATATVTVDVKNESYKDLINPYNDEFLSLYEDVAKVVSPSVEKHFKLGTSQKIDVSKLLDDSADLTNLGDYIVVSPGTSAGEIVLKIDRDGGNGHRYSSQEVLVLTNQKQAFDLDDLIDKNQIIY